MAVRKEDLIPVPVACIRKDDKVAFDIYVQGSPVLYHEKDLAFDGVALRRLAHSEVDEVYIPEEQEEAYLRYLERNLGDIVNDEGIPPKHKAQVLYSAGRFLMEEVLSDPRAGSTVPRSREFVEHMYTFLAKDQAAFAHLVKITSYDYYTYTHSINVFVFTMTLAQRMNRHSTHALKELGIGALLHDIGKSQIDPAILNCKGRLSEDQWMVMKQHPAMGCRLLEAHGGISDQALDVVLHHHEKINGKGYPDGLKGDQISPFARMSAITDIFDALTTRRPYKDALRAFNSLKLMKDDMTDELDHELLTMFIGVVGRPN